MAIEHRTVAEDEGETRLDRWFRRHFPRLTQGALQRMLRTGQVRVNGKRAGADTRLVPGQEVRIPPLPLGPAPGSGAGRRPLAAGDEGAARDLVARIIYRDDHVLVLDKPHGLPVQGGPGIRLSVDAMLDGLRFGAPERPRLVHRLDRDTSGVLVLARSAAAAARLAAAFRGRDVEKFYWALVVGEPEAPEGRIDLALAKLGGPRGERTRAVDDPAEGARAITDFRTLDTVKRRTAWLELRPLTGRTHQLRVHCAEALGCPVLGDGKYGGAAAHMEELPNRLHLHARALRLPHPDGGTLEVSAPLPPHMRESFKFLGFEVPRTPKPRHLAPGSRR
jgi:23S rRNA pseudouridine955/2504/2580 synthase